MNRHKKEHWTSVGSGKTRNDGNGNGNGNANSLAVL